jgi:gluconate 2-dehydrogenase gamma chain
MSDSKNNNNKSQSNSPQKPADTSRRDLLKGAGLLGAALAGGAHGPVIAQESATQDRGEQAQLREALEVLTAEEAETLEAICETLIPTDQNGPGAREARAAHYIDKSLASHNLQDRDDYLISLSAINAWSRQNHSAALAALTADDRESVLQALQNDEVPDCSPGSAAFFNLVRSHTIDGTFCDPYYGGNRDFTGWDLLRYPGVRLSASESDVALGAALEPSHESAYDNTAYTKRVPASNSGSSGNG